MYAVKCKNKDEKKKVADVLVSLGCSLGNFASVAELLVYCDGEIEFIGFDSLMTIDGFAQNHVNAKMIKVVTLPELVAKFLKLSEKPKEFQVNLNKHCTARVSKNGIEVGCQKFKLDIIDKLVQARKKALES